MCRKSQHVLMLRFHLITHLNRSILGVSLVISMILTRLSILLNKAQVRSVMCNKVSKSGDKSTCVSH